MNKILLTLMAMLFSIEIATASPAKSESLMVEPGKTWWYTNFYAPISEHEYGIQIAEPCEIDGEIWNPVKIVKSASFYKEKYFDDTPIGKWLIYDLDETICHVRQEGSKVYVRHESISINESFIPSWYKLGPFFNYYWGDNNFIESIIFEMDVCPQEDETFIYGNSDCYTSWKCKGVTEDMNSGINYQKYTIGCLDSDEPNYMMNVYSAGYSVIPQIGWVDPTTEVSMLFFAPGGICQVPTNPWVTNYELRYVTDADGEVIYTGIGGLKLWNMEMGVADAKIVEDSCREQWFTIDGVEVHNPDAAGVYIHRQGSKVSKVVIH